MVDLNHEGVTVSVVGSSEDIERCLAVRDAVFVREQGVPLDLEMDGRDADAIHFLMIDENRAPVGTARMFPYGDLAKIGRVAVLAASRGTGLGRVLMEYILAEAGRRGFQGALLSAQVPVVPFYERLGFVAEGPTYLDAGIPHRTMRLIFPTPH